MNGHERFIKAIKCEEIDQMPTFWMDITPGGTFQKVWNDFLNKDENPELDECVQFTPMGDLTQLNWYSKGTSSVLKIHAGGIQFPRAYYNKEEDRFYTEDEARSLPAKKKRYRINRAGSIRAYDELEQPGWYYGPYFTGPDFLERMDDFYAEFGAPWENEPVDNVNLARMRIKAAEDLDFPHAVAGGATNHFESIWGGFGAKSLAILMRKKPGKLKEICKNFEKVSIAMEKLALEAGHQIIQTGDDLGQKERTLISPKMYKKFFYPALKARCDLAHKHGAVIFMHSCGYMEELIPYFLEAGLDALQSLEVPAGNDLARIRSVVRDKMCLIGGIDSSRVMTFGSTADCISHVKKQMDAATMLDGERMNGGYIPGPAHNLINTPMDNVKAVRDAIAKYGKYPLQLD